MIYIKRNAGLIPESVLKVALRAQGQLEKMRASDRINFH